MSDIVQPQHNWLKISSIVDMACHRLDLSVSHYYQRFLEVAKWETMNLKLDRASEVKTVILPVSDLNTCQMPQDAIDWTKVGIVAGQYIKTIGLNPLLSKIDRVTGTPEFSLNAAPGSLPNGIAVQDYYGLEFFNYGGKSLMAIPGSLPHEGHFQVVNRTGYKEILLDGNLNVSEIIVEYISLGLNPCGDTLLDPYIADYILKCVLTFWEEEVNPKRTEASIERRKRDQAYAFSLVSGRTNSIDLATLSNIIRAAYRLTNHI